MAGSLRALAGDLRVRSLAAFGSDDQVAREVFQCVERRDLRNLPKLFSGRDKLPLSRSWSEHQNDGLELRSCPKHHAPDGRTPLMCALLAGPRHQMAVLSRKPSALQTFARTAPHSLRGVTADRALTRLSSSSSSSSRSIEPGHAWGCVAREAAAEWREDALLVHLYCVGRRIVGLVDSRGRFALHYAAAAGDTAVVERLRHAGAQAQATDHMGRTPAHFAAARGYDQLAKNLASSSSSASSLAASCDAFGHTVEGLLDRHAQIRQNGVPRMSGVSTHDLLNDFVAAGLPVLVEGGAADLPAMHHWKTPDKLSARLGGAALSVGKIPYPETVGVKARESTLEDFLHSDSCHVSAEGSAPDYAFDVTLGRRVPELLDDAELLHTSFCDEDLVSYVRYPQFGVGRRGAGAPMHVHFAALNALFVGVKRWFLLPPSEAFWGVEPAGVWASSVECEKLRHSGVLLEVVQYPGDVLFVPEGWGHATLLEEYCVGIGQEFIPRSSIWS
eukprot:TRINITY_DN4086_c0_g1_i1.p1 TRINITY_DN4086_c0_g1~~TRINITY_DN4086_c0_g1_i1.p1  ORF type:complete len:502 (-),score=63.43 TRINITY_DN4086_c0_g1_i1:117-1622(-)